MSSDIPPAPEEMPEPQSDTGFEAPSFPFQRQNALRIRLPGVTNEDARLPADTSQYLSEAITVSFEANAGLDMLEFLSWPGEIHQEFVFVPYGSRQSPERAQRTLRETADSSGDTGDLSLSPAEATVAANLEETLAPDIGLERCSVDLRPSHVTEVPTCRLVTRRNRAPAPLENLQYSPFDTLLRGRWCPGGPYLYQVPTCEGEQAPYMASS